MRFLQSVCLLMLGLSPVLPAKPAIYDPLTVAVVEIISKPFMVHDVGRDREIPIRMYLPDSKKPAPIILFSHGLGGSRDNNPYLGNHWAKRGYAVVFIQHPGSDESVWKDLLPRQRMAAMKQAASPASFLERVRDVPAVIDALIVWNKDKENPLSGRSDLKHIGMSGHSFGTGAIRSAVCARRTVIAEAIPAYGALHQPDRLPDEWLALRLAMGHPASMSEDQSPEIRKGVYIQNPICQSLLAPSDTSITIQIPMNVNTLPIIASLLLTTAPCALAEERAPSVTANEVAEHATKAKSIPFESLHMERFQAFVKNWDDAKNPVLCAQIRSEADWDARVGAAARGLGHADKKAVFGPDAKLYETKQILLVAHVTKGQATLKPVAVSLDPHGILTFSYTFEGAPKKNDDATYKWSLAVTIPRDLPIKSVRFLENGKKVGELNAAAAANVESKSGG